MTKLLALDTSTEACSVALFDQGKLYEKFEVMPRLHARKLLPMVKEMLSEHQLSVSQLDAIAFARGPGSFTGLRIAASVAQGLAFGADLAVLPVSTLAAMAQGAKRIHQSEAVLVMLDARMKEVYWACYDCRDSGVKLLGEEQLSFPGEVAEIANQELAWLGVGSGWQLRDQLPMRIGSSMTRVIDDFYPSARDVAMLAVQDFEAGVAGKPEQALPVYMRGESAWKKLDQQSST